MFYYIKKLLLIGLGITFCAFIASCFGHEASTDYINNLYDILGRILKVDI